MSTTVMHQNYASLMKLRSHCFTFVAEGRGREQTPAGDDIGVQKFRFESATAGKTQRSHPTDPGSHKCTGTVSSKTPEYHSGRCLS